MLYDTSGGILDTSDFTYFNEGMCANLFRNNDIVLKKYKDTCYYSYYFSKKVFNILKKLNLPSLVKLYKYYYENNSQLLRHFMIPEGYTMEYIDNPKLILLEQKKDYLLDIISQLEKDIIILTKNHIKISDAHGSNIILQENAAKIIDIDSFRIDHLLSYNSLLLHNKKELLYYIKCIIIRELKKKELYEYKFDYMFDFYNLSNTSVTDYFNNLLEDGIIEQSFKKNK